MRVYGYLYVEMPLCLHQASQKVEAKVTKSSSVSMQELLSLFGLPYLTAPSEAEAQCAALEECRLTQGSITDDSDIFLFGGEMVYRGFFSQDKDLEVYRGKEIERVLGEWVCPSEEWACLGTSYLSLS